MVEQWSSKSSVWVRFPLPLFMFNSPFYFWKTHPLSHFYFKNSPRKSPNLFLTYIASHEVKEGKRVLEIVPQQIITNSYTYKPKLLSLWQPNQTKNVLISKWIFKNTLFNVSASQILPTNLRNTLPLRLNTFTNFKQYFSTPISQNSNNPTLLFVLKFLEFLTNRHIALITRTTSINSLPLTFQIRLNLWLPKLTNFRKMFGRGFPLNETMTLLMTSLYIKDVECLGQWFGHLFKRISFWKYRLILHFIKYVFRFFFWPSFNDLGIKGLKFRFKGKISVAGNARTRNLNFSIGQSSSSTKNLRVLQKVLLVPSFTGVMAFQIWLFF